MNLICSGQETGQVTGFTRTVCTVFAAEYNSPVYIHTKHILKKKDIGCHTTHKPSNIILNLFRINNGYDLSVPNLLL